MRTAKADWELLVYGGTVHSFTSLDADRRNMPIMLRYSAVSDARSWAAMRALLSTTLAPTAEAGKLEEVQSCRSPVFT